VLAVHTRHRKCWICYCLLII